MGITVGFVGNLGCNFFVNILQVGSGLLVYVILLFVLKADFFMELLNSIRQRGLKNNG